ncbi:hypothetical protein ACE1TH_12210 [Shouchella sp. JSM 1781072]|nr:MULTISPECIES: hypothetical protein [Bacillaceae]UTR06905.1 hypothetical protein MM326_02420 [Alkalihalobacillus sp. LMS6]
MIHNELFCTHCKREVDEEDWLTVVFEPNRAQAEIFCEECKEKELLPKPS